MSINVMTAKITEFSLPGKTEKRELRTTSKRNNSSLVKHPRRFSLLKASVFSSTRGFTLLEVLIVMALGVAVMTIGGNTVSRITYQRVRSTTRQFVGTMRKVRNDAILLNSILRLGVDFSKGTWWIESQIKPGLIADPNVEPPKKGSKLTEPPPSGFALEARYNKKPTELPSGVVFSGLRKEREGLQKEGIGYIHFFPNGFAEQSILYLNKDGAPEDQSYSLIVRPTAGRFEVNNIYVSSFD